MLQMPTTSSPKAREEARCLGMISSRYASSQALHTVCETSDYVPIEWSVRALAERNSKPVLTSLDISDEFCK